VDEVDTRMGHASIITTAGYRHAAVEKADNPPDDLPVRGPEGENVG